MTKYTEVPIGELFQGINGRAKFIKDYIDTHSGDYPVYSASLTNAFGYVNEYEYDGHYLTWIMNGYGGRVQEISGKFSANRDRGVFVPRDGVTIPNLTYLRFAMEPQLVAAAVGRRVDGRQNEYTKIYPDNALEVLVRLPLNDSGQYDYNKMSELGAKFRRIEMAQEQVRRAQEPLLRAAFTIDVPEPSVTVSLSDSSIFSLSIGDRVTSPELKASGIPVYSANAIKPFGFVERSNLCDFNKPSLLWGIDGNFDWNIIPSNTEFATTDHCGRLQILNDKIDAEYLYWFLHTTRWRYAFDRVYRASLRNMRAEVTVTLPIDEKSGDFSIKKQHALVESIRKREQSRETSLTALEDVLKARVNAEL